MVMTGACLIIEMSTLSIIAALGREDCFMQGASTITWMEKDDS